MGDPHGFFGPVFEAAQMHQPEAIILLGDQQPGEPLSDILKDVPCPVWWILGNHDSDQPRFTTNHFPLWDFNLENRVVEIAGLRIAGLGAEFREEIWHPWDRRQDWLRMLDSKVKSLRIVFRKDGQQSFRKISTFCLIRLWQTF